MPSPWNDARYVFLQRKACPACSGTKFVHCWTSTETDGSRAQRQVCATCSTRIIFVFEPAEDSPPIGESDPTDSPE